MVKFTKAVGGALLLSVALLHAQDAALSGKLDEKISAALTASGAPSVSVAVVQNGQIVYAKAFGKADIAKDRAADANTRYAIGSISKQFTAAGLLLLQERGKLNLDAKVCFAPAQNRSGDLFYDGG